MLATVKQRVAAVLLSLSGVGAAGIIAHEGWVKVGYKDPVGIVTACAGHTATAELGRVYTDAECHELLRQDVREAEQAVRRLVKVRLTQDQFDALVSFTFNVGQGNLARSTLLRKLNAGDCWGAADEFLRWNRAGGQVFRGLTIRRQDERNLFIKGCAPNVAYDPALITAKVHPELSDLPSYAAFTRHHWRRYPDFAG